MRCFRAVFTALVLALLAPVCAWSQDVTLTSRDGSVELSGTLISYDGEFYRIDTIYGPLTVDGQGVQCSGIGCPDPEAFVARFAISGSARFGNGLMPALIGAFARQRGLSVTREVRDDDNSVFVLKTPEGDEQARIALRASTTAEGFADLIASEADIALALREINDSEAARAREAGQGELTRNARSRVIALDGLVPVVATRNRVTDITVDQLAQVFSGDITSWAALGGPDRPINLHLIARGRVVSDAFKQKVMDPAQKTFSDAITWHDTLDGLSDAVALDAQGIGITSWSAVANAHPLRLIGPCGAVLDATTRTLKSKDYPLDLPLLVYTPARRLPLLAREFLAFFNSPGAEIVIRRAGYVDQGIDRISLDAQGNRLANAIAAAGDEIALPELQRMVKALYGARRLSLSFRFRGGSTRLDAQSHGNITRLARALEGGAFDGRELIFVGFSDGQGGAPANQAISKRRAESVRSAIRSVAHMADFDKVRLLVEAFGEAMPVACDDSGWGREVNRRVEVWLR
ncbi:MAG: phosphate ABC transporter substrate-binding/OmpA family protein [Brevirhabdus sp.]